MAYEIQNYQYVDAFTVLGFFEFFPTTFGNVYMSIHKGLYLSFSTVPNFSDRQTCTKINKKLLKWSFILPLNPVYAASTTYKVRTTKNCMNESLTRKRSILKLRKLFFCSVVNVVKPFLGTRNHENLDFTP